jgi:hypothetical protein
MVMAGLLIALTTGYLTGAALVARSRGAFPESWSSRTVAAGWTLLAPPITSGWDDPRAVGRQ